MEEDVDAAGFFLIRMGTEVLEQVNTTMKELLMCL